MSRKLVSDLKLLIKSFSTHCTSIQQSRSASSLAFKNAYINGQWVPAEDGRTFPVRNPANGDLISEVPDMQAKETETAVNHASDAFKRWKNYTAIERSILLKKWHDIMTKNQEGLAQIVTAENGKPLAEARGEITYGLSFVEWFAEEGKRIYGDVIPSAFQSKRLLHLKQPVGVCGIITPWNSPSAMILRTVGAALAAGCTVVVKPAEDTPLSALATCYFAEQAGIPAGVLNVVTCSQQHVSEVGRVLCQSPKVSKISFTGSSATGKILMKQSVDTVKRVSMELGGHAAFIVFNSADVDAAVVGAVAAKFRGAGQTCISPNRMLVQEEVYDEFCEKLVKVVSQFVVGDGQEDGTTQGPLIHEKAVNKVDSHVKDAVAKGGKVLIGGERHVKGPTFYSPTVIRDITEDMLVCSEETFGPLAPVIKFKNEEEAVLLANSTRFGLAGYFYSQDIRQIWRVAEDLEVGMVGINEGIIFSPSIAFGGIKESGLGREGSKYGIDEYLNIKYTCFGGIC
ncbi:succinate-semialdehyde dehydrogenase, mitochondrial-like [Anneissia japonica]|uniref:succinate-semialdehyde dehydrogenase, mitochondrial-like n=1 Tax=Anneissia japonica TaxID=1529436 RepID=UPI001425B878|nr:succinate-semialdehyde dehydrogenase, mitochondrial-like [Anneissia japonica]